jgi:hypothetical protein
MRTPPTTAPDTSSLPPLLLHQHDEDGTNNKVNNNNNNNVYKRREVMQGHGFRKFFDTTSTIAGMNPVYIEFCMGHSLGLKGRYAKPSPTDLLEGNDKNLGYISAINCYTPRQECQLC